LNFRADSGAYLWVSEEACVTGIGTHPVPFHTSIYPRYPAFRTTTCLDSNPIPGSRMALNHHKQMAALTIFGFWSVAVVSALSMSFRQYSDPCQVSDVSCIGSSSECCPDGRSFVHCDGTSLQHISCGSLTCVTVGAGSVSCAAPLPPGQECVLGCCFYSGAQCYCQC